jgi:hypothetical protein
MNLFGLIVLPLLLLGSPKFTDPSSKGASFRTDYPFIPESYVGEWQKNPRSCGTARSVMIDRGSGVVIARRHISGVPVLSVEAYSDYPAVFVSIGTDGFTTQRIYLDISDDQMWLKGNNDGGGRNRLFRRCPVQPITTADDRFWLTALRGACASKNRDAFVEAFLASEAVQREVLRRQILILRLDLPVERKSRDYYQAPPILVKNGKHYYDDGREELSQLKIDVVALKGRDFALDWVRIDENELMRVVPGEEDSGESARAWLGTYGPHRRLNFKFTRGCWRLVSDELSIAS